MRCPCCECNCERHEPPEPEEHDARFKGHDINVSKDAGLSKRHLARGYRRSQARGDVDPL
jgi:hypothetical protein